MKYLSVEISLIVLLFACNPVKQVLKDQVKFEQVKEEVIRRGYCVNDTIIETKEKEVVVYKDSIVRQVEPVPCKDFDTIIGSARISVKSGVLTYTAKDSVVYRTKTIKEVIRDRSLEAILEADIVKGSKRIDSLNKALDLAKIDNKNLKGELAWMKIKLFGLLLISAIIIFRKQIIRIAGGIV